MAGWDSNPGPSSYINPSAFLNVNFLFRPAATAPTASIIVSFIFDSSCFKVLYTDNVPKKRAKNVGIGNPSAHDTKPTSTTKRIRYNANIRFIFGCDVCFLNNHGVIFPLGVEPITQGYAPTLLDFQRLFFSQSRESCKPPVTPVLHKMCPFLWTVVSPS